MVTYIIDKILNYKTYSIKRKIDALLEMDANLYCNLGTDSTKAERQEAKKSSKQIYIAIRTLDKDMGNKLLYHMDK